MDICARRPGFYHSLSTLLLILLMVSLGLFVFKISLHSILLLCLFVASVSAYPLCKNGFADIREAMNEGIKKALPAIYIFILIGVLIAALIQSGTIATLVYYSLMLLSPSIFLPATLILCSLMSIATGTSWGTVGTIGIVLMAVGSAMGLPPPLVAGAVVSGACFGDKMSPLSDTTNLAAMSSGVPLYKHINSMLYTTGPTYLLVLFIYTIIGSYHISHSMPVTSINEMLVVLDKTWVINIFSLLPILLMIVLMYKKISAEVSMLITSLVAVSVAVSLQQADFVSVLNALHSGGKSTTGTSLDTLFRRGGITSMMWTLSLALLALAMGGILSQFGFLNVIVEGVLKRVKSTSYMVSITIFCCFFGNMALGEAYMSIILSGQLFKSAYKKNNIDPRVLSRSIEDGATLTTVIIPWTTGGVFFSTTLGVDVLDYAPWALLNWINPLVSILFALLGIAIFKKPCTGKIALKKVE